MYSKIILAGGSGYLGQVLADHFRFQCKEIIILSRKPHAADGNIRYQVWDARTMGEWVQCLENADLLVNLSGKNVNCRYTKKNREEILNSRVYSTSILGEAINRLQHPPRVWINLASATIYRHAEDRMQDEYSGETGTGFSVNVCRAWEKTFFDAATPRTRKIVMRTGIVLGRKDAVTPKLVNLARFGLGGRSGSGEQFVSWIHELDFARITEWLYLNGKDGGIYNVTAPEAIRNKELMKLIRRNLGIRVGLPAPEWLLGIGAAIIGTETELVLKSRWVFPSRLLKAGYSFSFPRASHAIREILSTRI